MTNDSTQPPDAGHSGSWRRPQIRPAAGFPPPAGPQGDDRWPVAPPSTGHPPSPPSLTSATIGERGWTTTATPPLTPPPSPPLADLPVTPSPPPPPVGRTTPRRGRLPWLVAVVSLLLAAFAGGWAVAENRANDRIDTLESGLVAPAVVEAPSPEDRATSAQPSVEPASPPAASAPVVPLDPDSEPASAAAGVVAPAVVLITTGEGQGSGIVYSADGHIVTNAHVVGAAQTVDVQLASGRRVNGSVVGRDTAVDVAVVKIDAAEEFGVAEFAPGGSVEVGQLAVAIGSPFGLEQTVTAGIVSAVDRVVINELDGTPNVVSMVQTDAPINPGNSGGALVDREGRVIGMNTSIRTDGGQGSVGLGFAIPADTVALIAQRIIDGVALDVGFLGVELSEPVSGDPGAVIGAATAGGPADDAGIASGDLVVGFGDQPVRSTQELAARVRLTLPGTVVDVELVRDGTTLTIPVTVGKLGDA